MPLRESQQLPYATTADATHKACLCSTTDTGKEYMHSLTHMPLAHCHRSFSSVQQVTSPAKMTAFSCLVGMYQRHAHALDCTTSRPHDTPASCTIWGSCNVSSDHEPRLGLWQLPTVHCPEARPHIPVVQVACKPDLLEMISIHEVCSSYTTELGPLQARFANSVSVQCPRGRVQKLCRADASIRCRAVRRCK